MRTNLATVLDPNRRSNDAGEFETALRRRIVGQELAIEKVVEIFQMFLAGLNAPGRPVGNLLFLGPTGSGKTRVVEAMAEALFGDAHACHSTPERLAVDAVAIAMQPSGAVSSGNASTIVGRSTRRLDAP